MRESSTAAMEHRRDFSARPDFWKKSANTSMLCERKAIPMRRDRTPLRDNSRNLSIRMTDIQYQRLHKYMKLTHLNSAVYFRRLIGETPIKGHSRKLNQALHASVNRIYSNARQITRCQRAKAMDRQAAAKIEILADELCREIYLLANQK